MISPLTILFSNSNPKELKTGTFVSKFGIFLFLQNITNRQVWRSWIQIWQQFSLKFSPKIPKWSILGQYSPITHFWSQFSCFSATFWGLKNWRVLVSNMTNFLKIGPQNQSNKAFFVPSLCNFDFPRSFPMTQIWGYWLQIWQYYF